MKITADDKRVHDYTTRQGTINAIIWECFRQGIRLHKEIAYVLATTDWETAHTFKPVKEAFWLSEKWRRKNLRYSPFYGRGFVQLTHRENYKKYSKIMGVDMLVNPKIAMRPDVALFILVHGFKNGTFTGRKISKYINKDKTDYIGARRCINGYVTGRKNAKKIARNAKKFLKKLPAMIAKIEGIEAGKNEVVQGITSTGEEEGKPIVFNKGNLKSCPFCGEYELVYAEDLGDTHHVVCNKCYSSIIGDTKDEAIKKWNGRTSASINEIVDDTLLNNVIAEALTDLKTQLKDKFPKFMDSFLSPTFADVCGWALTTNQQESETKE